MTGEQLRAEANTQEWLVLLERNADPLDLATQPVLLVVDAHRAAEHHHTRMIAHALRQRIAQGRTANVERGAKVA